jgi:hypothetical protein
LSQIAAKLTDALGRTIEHVKISEGEKVQRFLDAGFPEHYGKFLAYLEASSAKGIEERMNDVVENVTGRPPQKFDEWVAENRAAFE